MAAIMVPVIDAQGRQLASYWAYNPSLCPLVIYVVIRTREFPGLLPGMGGMETQPLGGEVFLVSRQLVMEAYAQTPHQVGAGKVRVRVRDQRHTQLSLIPQAPWEPGVFLVPTQEVVGFVAGSRTQVPSCLVGGSCRAPGCFECAWLARNIPACSCGMVGCEMFRPVECPPEEYL